MITQELVYDALFSKIEYTRKKKILEKDSKFLDITIILWKVIKGEIITEQERKRLWSQLEYTFKKELESTNFTNIVQIIQNKTKSNHKVTKTEIALFYLLKNN